MQSKDNTIGGKTKRRQDIEYGYYIDQEKGSMPLSKF